MPRRAGDSRARDLLARPPFPAGPFVSIRRVVQVRLDRRPARPSRRAISALLVAIVSRQRSCTPSLLHTVFGYPLHDHVAFEGYRTSWTAVARGAVSGTALLPLFSGGGAARPLLLPLVRSGCVRTVDSAEIGSCSATELKSRCGRRHFWIASANGHLVDADRESAPSAQRSTAPHRCRNAGAMQERAPARCETPPGGGGGVMSGRAGRRSGRLGRGRGRRFCRRSG